VQAQTPVFTDSKQFSAQLAPTLGVHFTANYKWNKKHTTHEVALKVLNITAQREFRGYRYNFVKGTIDRQDELIFIPNLSYRVEF
jgi:hypothetical protein